MKQFLIVLLLAAPVTAQTSFSDRTQFRWDLLLRYDEVEDFPRNPPVSFDRTRLQLRGGVTYTPSPMITLESRIALHSDSEGNEFFRLGDGSAKIGPIRGHDHLSFTGRQDNFRPDSVAIDRLNIQVRPAAGVEIMVGKFQHPFDHTEATWDLDLQPEGVAGSWSLGDANSLHSKATGAGYFGSQLYGDESVILGGQYTLSGSESWPVTFDVSLAYFDFSDLDVLGRRNWRQNSTAVVGGVRRYLSEFEVADAIFRVRSDRWLPIEAHVNVIRNLGARNDDEGDGLDAGIRVGRITRPGTVRFSYTFQDLDRDAVMDGFNGDDWYLHSWYRGSLYRLGVGIWRSFAIQGTYVDMDHHETTFPTTRLMIDLVKRY